MRNRILDALLQFLLAACSLATIVYVVVRVFELGLDLQWWWFFGVVLIIVMSVTPLYLDRYDAWLVIGLEASVLVFVSLTLEPHLALLLWCVGVTIAQFAPWSGRYKFFNATVTIASGAVAVAAVDLITGGRSEFGGREAIAVLVAFTLYYALDVMASMVSLDLESASDHVRTERLAESAVLYLIFMGVNTLGYLAVLVHRGSSDLALVLFLAPIAIILLAVRTLTRERETARRLTVLFGAARAMHSARSEAQILHEMGRGVAAFGKTSGAGLREIPPRASEIGRPFICNEEVYWLVLDERRGPRANTLPNAEALSNLVQQGEEALSRLHLTRELTFNAQHDPLTTLTNRSVFLKKVEAALSEIRRRPGQCAVLFCDLDGFKKVNDQFGHEMGDAVLVEIARRLDRTLADDVDIARLGGDEFAILSKEGAHGSRSEEVAELIREVIAQPIDLAANQIVISISIGMAFSNGTHSADQLVRNADIAMYDAKRMGKDRVVEYHPLMGTARVRALEMVDHLRNAIESRELSVVYQPVVAARDGRTVAIEALTRWTRDGETIPPDVFIPIAEESNLIRPLGELILELVAEDVPVLDACLAPDVQVAINISALQLSSASFVDAAYRMQDALGTHPLILEITESEAMSDEVISSAVMEEMVNHGVAFAVDDFGVGFSSLGYLMKLPVTSFKLDRLFSGSIDRDRRNAELLASVVGMGQALGLLIVVEGIERTSQIEVIQSMVDPDAFDSISWQGYLLGKPMPAASLATWVNCYTGIKPHVRRH